MSGCKCSISIDHNEGPTFFSAKDPVAKKEYKCCECGRVIKPGETYRSESGMWDGRINTYKTCPECYSIRSTFFCSYVFGEVLENFKDEAEYNDGKFSPDCIAQLIPTAKQVVLDIIKKVRREAREAMAED